MSEENVERVKCSDCAAMILPATALSNGGLCMPCYKTPKKFREERKIYKASLLSGEVFQPASGDVPLAKSLKDFPAHNNWVLQPEYYEDDDIGDAESVMARATHLEEGNVFLVFEKSQQLNLAFNERYGIIECHNWDEDYSAYIHTDDNLTAQVTAESHLSQNCNCCGVGLNWFPSRFHMPRALAFDIYKAIVNNDERPHVIWLPMGDITYTAKGTG